MACGQKPAKVAATKPRPIPAPKQAKPANATQPPVEMPVTVADFYCDRCGFSMPSMNQPAEHNCHPDRRPYTWVDERRDTCRMCEFNDDGICRQVKSKFPDRDAVIETGVTQFESRCPIDKWLAVSLRCPRCDYPSVNYSGISRCSQCGWIGEPLRIELPQATNRTRLHDTVVVTAADERFVPGVLQLLATLAVCNDVPAVVFDLGLSEHSITRIKATGADVAEPPALIVPKGSRHQWQAWSKPQLVQTLLPLEMNLVWLNADITVGGSLTELVAGIDQHPFVPDHGDLRPKHVNNRAAVSVLQKPAKRWRGGDLPCAAVLGLRAGRDAAFVARWVDHVRRVQTELPELFEYLPYYDQSILSQMVDFPCSDGRIWNRLDQPRRVSPQESISRTFDGRATITHWGGPHKPWFRWPDVKYVNRSDS